MKTCTIDGCEKPTVGRGWCRKHYNRWHRHGDPLGGGERYADPAEAFEARTEPLCWTGCLIWTGVVDSHGYGQLRVDGRLVQAHRYAWEREHGPIPSGMVLDHMCWERSCVNVDHLRVCSQAENARNRKGAQSGRKHDLPRGVTRSGRGYAARVKRNGQSHYLGLFDTPEEASAAASEARRIHFGIYAGNA